MTIFVTVGNKLVEQLKTTNPGLTRSDFVRYLNKPSCSSKYLSPFDLTEILKLIDQIKTKSPGPDG
jgi:hypothetical protein